MKKNLFLHAVGASLLFLVSGCSRPVASPTTGMRVASLAPNLTEIVCSVGGADLLVGRTSACDYPPEIAKVKVIGGFGTPSLELLTSIAPTLVLEVDLDDQAIGRKIDNLGIHRQHVSCQRLDDIPTAIRTVGALIGRTNAAGAFADDLDVKIAALRTRAELETNRPSVYVEIWHDPIMTVGTNAFLSELVHLAGGRNIGDDVEKDYFQTSSEWVVAKNPEIILCLYMSDKGSAKEDVLRRAGWQSVKAVRQGTVYDGFNNDLVLRPGPRVLQSIELLKKRIQPSGSP